MTARGNPHVTGVYCCKWERTPRAGCRLYENGLQYCGDNVIDYDTNFDDDAQGNSYGDSEDVRETHTGQDESP